MNQIIEKIESFMELGGTRKDIAFLVISGIALIFSMAAPELLPFDPAWIAIILCGIPIIMEATIGMITAFDIKADLLVSLALIASVCIGEDFAAGEVAFIMQLGGLLEELTVANARAGIEKLVHLTPQTARVLRNGKEEMIPAQQVQVGKSTVINRVLEALNVPYKGFRTYGAEYKEDGSSVVYISPADNPDDKTVAAYRGGNGHSKMEVNKDAFEVKGVEILKNSLNSDVELILMDEIGFMESHFEGFKDAIRDVLNSDKNILGVVRNKDTEFLNEVRNHASVQVVIVNNENRNDLPETLVNMLRGFYGKDSNYKRK